ncbi:uncharacterized protein LOC123988191 [Osmia bicornis bicornis]|uniref:uncharacterized protein LOC123988191 n=1 Tax=Osmia bicornis bicornis TaxID=1437191 RepID=UPI001EAEF910|nr:uncharacterized protein LOC123988191 [Osmia bicornis bicornis]
MGPGQGEYTLKRIKKKTIRNEEVEWVEGAAIRIEFKGDRLPTELLLGEGHIGLKIHPYIEKVKQCYNCYAFGHFQNQCKMLEKRCLVCLSKEHGRCDKSPKCLNCGGAHTSLARTCWMYQRERAVKKVMAYKNVDYVTARQTVARQLGEVWNEEEMRRDAGSRDFPSLPKSRVDCWERKEVPLEAELASIKESREEVDPTIMEKRRWETTLNNMRINMLSGRGKGRGRGRLSEADRVETRRPSSSGEFSRASPRTAPAAEAGFISVNRYGGLQEEKEDVEEVVEEEYTFGNGLPVERAVKKSSRMKERANRELVEKLRKKREDEFLNDLLNLIIEKGYEDEMEAMLINNKKSKNTRSEEEEFAYWNTIQHRPHWEVPIPEKTKEKFRRKRERAQQLEEARIAQQEKLEEIAIQVRQKVAREVEEEFHQEEEYRRSRIEDPMQRIEGRVRGGRGDNNYVG